MVRIIQEYVELYFVKLYNRGQDYFFIWRMFMNVYLIDYENVNASGLEGIKKLNDDDKVKIFYSDRIKSIPFARSVEMIQSKAEIEFIETRKVAKNYLDFQLSTYLGYLIGRGENGCVFVISKDTGFDSVVDFWKARNIKICRQENILGNKKNPSVAKKTNTSDKQPAKVEIKEFKSEDTANSETQHLNKTQKISKEQIKERAAVKEPSKAHELKKQDIVKKSSQQKKEYLSEVYRKKVRAAVKGDKLAPSGYTVIYRAIVECKEKLELNNILVKSFGSSKGGEVYGHIKDIFNEYKQG